MKTKGIGKIPSGKVKAPSNHHMALAQIFATLAAHHAGRAMANAPDKAVAPLPRPDKAALNSRQPGGYQGRQPVIGTPNNPV